MDVLCWIGWCLIAFVVFGVVKMRCTICWVNRLVCSLVFVLLLMVLCITLLSIDCDFVSWVKKVWVPTYRSLYPVSFENYTRLWDRHWPTIVVMFLLVFAIACWCKKPLGWLRGLGLQKKNDFRECGDDDPLDGSDLEAYVAGRKVFIEHVWHVIDETASCTCSQCIGLFSAWGDGKTSVYNGIKNQCKRDDTIFVDFKPWRHPNFKEHPYILFNLISESLASICPPLFHAFARFSGNVEFKKTLSDIASTNGWLAGLRTLFGRAGSDRKARERLRACLRHYRQHIVVVVDDLDRLASADVCEVLRILKTNDDLPCITYLLLADYEYIEQSVQDAAPKSGGDDFGRRYLEKLISRRIDLPKIDSQLVVEELKKQLKTELQYLGLPEEKIKIIDSDPMETVLPFLHNFRDVKRYKLSFLRLVDYMCSKCSEYTFDLSDVLAIAAIEVFVPNFYGRVAELGAACILGECRKDNWIKENLLKCESTELTEVMLDFLKAHMGIRSIDGVRYEDEADREEARRTYRLMSPDFFKVYFADNVKIGVVSSADWHLIRKALSKSSDAYENELSRLYKEKKLLDYLKKFNLNDIEDSDGLLNVEYAIEGLISFCDQTLFHGDEWYLSFQEEIEKLYRQLLSVVERCIASVVADDSKKQKVLGWLGDSLLVAGFVQCRMRNCFSDNDIETIRASFLKNVSRAKISKNWLECDKRLFLEMYWYEAAQNKADAREDFKKLHSNDVKNLTSAAILILQFKKNSQHGAVLDVKALLEYMGENLAREMFDTFKKEKKDWSDFDSGRRRSLELLIFCLQHCVEVNFQGCDVDTLGEWVSDYMFKKQFGLDE